MYERLQRWYFPFRAFDEFGIHSPFVFDLVTTGIYRRPLIEKNYGLMLLLGVSDHLRLSRIGCSEGLQWSATAGLPYSGYEGEPPELYAFESPSTARAGLGTIPENTVIYMDRPYVSRRERLIMEELFLRPDYRVGIDFFYSAFLFPRPEQQKEVFRIRLK